MILPFIVSGLVTGAVYGLAGVGLTLTYKTSGVFNFAHGALATVAAYVFYTLHVQLGVSWPIAAFISVFVLGPILALIAERFAKAIAGRSLALMVTSTVGALLVIQAAISLIYGLEEVRTVPVFLASGAFQLFGTEIQYSDLVTFVFAVAVTTALVIFFRVARAGSAMRAVVDDPDLLEVSGTSTTSVRRLAWMIGICLVCASGVLFSSLLPLDPVLLTLLVVQAFGAAAIGAFRSLPLTFIGGLLIGVLASLATKYFTTGILAGIPPALPFIVLFVVLLVFPRKYLREHSVVKPVGAQRWTTPWQVQLAGGAALLIFLAFVPSFAGIHLTDWTVALAYVILFLSLGLLVRTAGQVSLCHVSFMAIGAAAFGHLSSDLGIPWLPALLLAALIAVPAGALLAIPAMRLTPLYLALATFGFGVFLQYAFYTQDFMFGSTGAGLDMPRPTWLGLDSDEGFYYLVLAIAVLSAAVMITLKESRLGRLLRAMADSPTAVATSGAGVRIAWVLVFCLSAAFAAGAGALAGMAQTTVSLLSYPPLLSLTFLALIVIVLGGAPWYAVIAGLALIVPPSYLTSTNTSYWLQLIFGASAILYAIAPEGVGGAPKRLSNWLDSAFRRAKDDDRSETEHVDDLVAQARERVAAGVLELDRITVRFGGLVAVQDVSLTAPTGRITGLIGPNGAGKTTIFNTCSGLVMPTEGRVLLDGRDVTNASVDRRARLGLGRTFQRMHLFESLTVWDNVAMGAEASLAGTNPIRHVIGSRRDKKLVSALAEQALSLCDLTELRNRQVAGLSTGHRRLVDLARCLAGPYHIMLLDEPSSGLDPAESERLGRILRRIVAERDVGILLVEHDMSLVMDVCAHIYVLDFGRTVYQGSPAEVRASAVVRAAYLGGEEVEAVVADGLTGVTQNDGER